MHCIAKFERKRTPRVLVYFEGTEYKVCFASFSLIEQEPISLRILFLNLSEEEPNVLCCIPGTSTPVTSLSLNDANQWLANGGGKPVIYSSLNSSSMQTSTSQQKKMNIFVYTNVCILSPPSLKN